MGAEEEDADGVLHRKHVDVTHVGDDKAWVQGIPRSEQELTETIEIKAVIHISGISTAPAHRHELRGAQFAQVVGDEVDWLPGKLNEFMDLPVTARESGHEEPAEITR